MELFLNLVIWLPILAGLGILLLPRSVEFLAYYAGLAATFFGMIFAALVFFAFAPGTIGYQFVTEKAWVDAIGISYRVGVDGLSVGLILMGAIVGFAATAMSRDVRDREKEYYALLMFMVGGILGAFASMDLFFFYFFHEFALVPTFLMIGMWGRGDQKTYAAFNITLYLSVGALLSLIGLIALYLQLPMEARTFNLVDLTSFFQNNAMEAGAQRWIFGLLMFGFGILVSLWPFHSWAPLGYGAAPTGTAMMHAGVIKKFGLYGLIRIALPMMPSGAAFWLEWLALLCLGNIIYCGLVAMKQKDLNQLIGNSSVAHMGFVFLGIASVSLVGITGAVVVMFAHGLLAALSFGLSGYLYRQTHDLEMSKFGGLASQLPFVGTAFTMAAMAGCGLPGFANFAGEVMVFFGAWKAFPIVTGIAVWGGLVIGAVYMLRAVRTIFHGESRDFWNSLEDPPSRFPYVLLLGVLLIFGFFPGLLTERIQPAAEQIVSMAGGDMGDAEVVVEEVAHNEVEAAEH